MNKLFNLPNKKYGRKKLRNNMTEAEIVLWSKLKNKQLNGYKFRRQVSINKYIVDFYCPKLKLVLEIDGDLHYLSNKTIKYDKIRQCSIELLGVNFLRFTNIEVYKNLDGVLRTIESRVIELRSTPPPALARAGTSPHLRGGKQSKERKITQKNGKNYIKY